jgi:hypothetical protein
MEVEVGNGLAAVGTDVGDDTETVFKLELLCHSSNDLIDMSHNGAVFGSNGIGSGNVSFGDHQEMNGGLGIDVIESQYLIVFIYFIGRDLAGCDLTKQAIHKR